MPVADHVAVAGDVGGDDRRAGGERLGQHHPERLPAQRGRAEHVRALQHLPLAVVADPAQRDHALGVDQQRRQLVRVDADDGELGRDLAAQRLERAQQHREALALQGLADERDPQRLARRAHGRGRRAAFGHRHAVGDDHVAAAVEAPPGPGGRLGHRDPPRQAVELAPGAQQRCDHVRRRALGVAVERADQRGVRGGQGVPAHHGRDRLVQVDDVVAAPAQLATQGRGRVRRVREVGDGAVGRPAERGPERDQPVRALARLRARTTMQHRRAAGVVVEGGEHADVVPGRVQLGGQGLDVPGHAARVGPGVRGDQGDPHRIDPIGWRGSPAFG